VNDYKVKLQIIDSNGNKVASTNSIDLKAIKILKESNNISVLDDSLQELLEKIERENNF